MIKFVQQITDTVAICPQRQTDEKDCSYLTSGETFWLILTAFMRHPLTPALCFKSHKWCDFQLVFFFKVFFLSIHLCLNRGLTSSESAISCFLHLFGPKVNISNKTVSCKFVFHLCIGEGWEQWQARHTEKWVCLNECEVVCLLS